jgi:hypothetical protein
MRKLLILTTLLVSLLTYQALADSFRHMKKVCIGTADKDTLGQVDSMIQNDDKEAVVKLVHSGDAYLFKSGESVYPIKGEDFFTNWLVRPKGNTKTYWIHVEDMD